MPDPRRVRSLLARYASARIALEEKCTRAWQQELEDVTYTLCVLTGARSIADAIAAADGILERHRQEQREVPSATAGEDTVLAA